MRESFQHKRFSGFHEKKRRLTVGDRFHESERFQHKRFSGFHEKERRLTV